MRFVFSLVLSIVALLFAAPDLQAKSLALVVGNDDYDNVPKLRRAKADADGYAQFFQDNGYAVTLAKDLDARGMNETLALFYDQIAPGDTVVFVYSGHGWSDGRQNYLIATDIRAEGSETLLSAESFSLRNGASGIIDQINARSPALTVAIVDACRDSPFTKPDGTRSVGLSRGLVLITPPSGTFVAFSAGAGQTALDRLSDDDTETYSVFTRYFLSELAKDIDLQTAFKSTQLAVSQAATTVGHAQRPAYYDEVVGSACLTAACLDGSGGSDGTKTDVSGTKEPAPEPVKPEPERPEPVKPDPVQPTPGSEVQGPPAPEPMEMARLEWQDFKTSNSIAALKSFAERHKGTPYADLAAERIAMLQGAPPAPGGKGTGEVVSVEPDPPKDPEVESDLSRRPSWCDAAKTRTEKAICDDRQLSILDARLSRLYETVVNERSGFEQMRLRADQHNWLAERDRCGRNTECIAAAYLERLTALQE